MTWDIEKTPPTTEVIKKGLRKTRIYNIFVIGMFFVICGCYLFYSFNNTPTQIIVDASRQSYVEKIFTVKNALVDCFLVLFVAFFTWLFYADTSLFFSLDPARYAEAISMCKANETCEQYRLYAAQQGDC